MLKKLALVLLLAVVCQNLAPAEAGVIKKIKGAIEHIKGIFRHGHGEHEHCDQSGEEHDIKDNVIEKGSSVRDNTILVTEPVRASESTPVPIVTTPSTPYPILDIRSDFERTSDGNIPMPDGVNTRFLIDPKDQECPEGEQRDDDNVCREIID